MPEPLARTGNDTRPDPTPIYCYIVRHLELEGSETIFLTQWEDEIEIQGIPEAFEADEPQVFTPAVIGHGRISREGGFQNAGFEITGQTANFGELSQYALTAAIPKIRIDVVKVSPGPVLSGGNPIWGKDTFIAQSGLVSSFGFSGRSVAAECVPTPLFGGTEIPRLRWSRICNHQLYGASCRKDPEGFGISGSVVSLDIHAKEITINAIHGSDEGNFFRLGVAKHQQTGFLLSIFKTEIDTQAETTKITVHQWQPELKIGDNLTLRAGCDHTFETCKMKFNNAPNFGGFTGVPGSNPTYHGISA